MMPADKKIKILDIGCGMGFFLMALRQCGYLSAAGIDSDMSQVNSCKLKQLDVAYCSDTVQYLKDQKEHYDLVTAFDVIEHIPPEFQVQFVRAIWISLKPGGKCMLTTPNATSFLGTHNRYVDYTHQSLFTTVSLDFIIYNGGFREIDIRPFEYVRFDNGIKSFAHKMLFKTFRSIRRLQYMAELGTTWGKKVPLSFNLIALAGKVGSS